MDEVARIELPRKDGPSLWAVVDRLDLDLVSQFRWVVSDGGTTSYARATVRSGGLRRFVYMHRLIMAAQPGTEVDHADRNGLNNRRSNLRMATRSQNLQNRGSHTRGGKPSTSQYKGVSWDKARSAWKTNINVNGRQEHLGRHPSEVEAAVAYDRRAREAFGSFAFLNFPDSLPDVA